MSWMRICLQRFGGFVVNRDPRELLLALLHFRKVTFPVFFSQDHSLLELHLACRTFCFLKSRDISGDVQKPHVFS